MIDLDEIRKRAGEPPRLDNVGARLDQLHNAEKDRAALLVYLTRQGLDHVGDMFELRKQLDALREAAVKAANDMDDIATDLDLLGRATMKQQLRDASADLRALLQETPHRSARHE